MKFKATVKCGLELEQSDQVAFEIQDASSGGRTETAAGRSWILVKSATKASLQGAVD